MKRMRLLRLDHGAHAPRWLRAPALALAAALLACAAQGLYAFRLAESALQLQQLEAARLQVAGYGAPKRGQERARKRLAPSDETLAAQLRAELAKPWERLFSAIEDSTGPDVSLLSLTPTPGRPQLQIGGEARSMAALLAFLKRLQESGAYPGVYLREHHVDPADPRQAVRFSMELRWERSI